MKNNKKINEQFNEIKKLKKRIDFLENAIRNYYRAVYDAKRAVGYRGKFCIDGLVGYEELLIKTDAEGLKKIINNLPLLDCGL